MIKSITILPIPTFLCNTQALFAYKFFAYLSATILITYTGDVPLAFRGEDYMRHWPTISRQFLPQSQ